MTLASTPTRQAADASDFEAAKAARAARFGIPIKPTVKPEDKPKVRVSLTLTLTLPLALTLILTLTLTLTLINHNRNRNLRRSNRARAPPCVRATRGARRERSACLNRARVGCGIGLGC